MGWGGRIPLKYRDFFPQSFRETVVGGWEDGDGAHLVASSFVSVLASGRERPNGGRQPTSKMAAGGFVPSPSAPAERGGRAPCTCRRRRGRRRRRRRGRRRRRRHFPRARGSDTERAQGAESETLPEFGERPRSGAQTLGAASPSPLRACRLPGCPSPALLSSSPGGSALLFGEGGVWSLGPCRVRSGCCRGVARTWRRGETRRGVEHGTGFGCLVCEHHRVCGCT